MTAAARTVVLMVPPRLNAMYRIGIHRVTKKPGIFLTKRARMWKKGQAQMLAFLRPCIPKPREVWVVVTWSQAPGDKGDLDGLLKLLLDALQGYAYANDSQVSGLTVVRTRGAKKSSVGVSVREIFPD